MKCPNCGGTHVHFVTSTQSRGPSVSNGCCGAILFGPIGLLCSLFGTGSSTREFWVCDNCGREFQTNEAEKTAKNDIERLAICRETLKECPGNLEQLLAEAEAELAEEKRRYSEEFRKIRGSTPRLKIRQVMTYVGYGVAGLIALIGLLGLVNGEFLLGLVLILVGFAIGVFADSRETASIKRNAPEEYGALETILNAQIETKKRMAPLKNYAKIKSEAAGLEQKIRRGKD